MLIAANKPPPMITAMTAIATQLPQDANAKTVTAAKIITASSTGSRSSPSLLNKIRRITRLLHSARSPSRTDPRGSARDAAGIPQRVVLLSASAMRSAA
ncbi:MULTISPECIES: hypothetical protein [Lentzea]|uniref:Uncharacterized protein n=1 Tax=Lentzea sokolovensis TaxID=3095429 RepID=A0ABU4ULX9_9PSEU|nr:MULTISPECIES: hypothetical protein [Lentzea]MDX8140500.1 hypothetical protein [Lentzea sp. BCCO 10_0061]